jgi:Integrase core domain
MSTTLSPSIRRSASIASASRVNSRTGAAFIEPGSPWENPFLESFNSRVRDELLAVEVFTCLAEAKVIVENYRQDYNRYRPHRAHGMMTPAAFKTGWGTAHQAAPASAELHDRYAIAPFNAGGSLTMESPTNHQLSPQMDLWTGSGQPYVRPRLSTDRGRR